MSLCRDCRSRWMQAGCEGRCRDCYRERHPEIDRGGRPTRAAWQRLIRPEPPALERTRVVNGVAFDVVWDGAIR